MQLFITQKYTIKYYLLLPDYRLSVTWTLKAELVF